jgi:hypothetical protein
MMQKNKSHTRFHTYIPMQHHMGASILSKLNEIEAYYLLLPWQVVTRVISFCIKIVISHVVMHNDSLQIVLHSF